MNAPWDFVCKRFQESYAIALYTYFYVFLREKDLEAKFIIEIEGKKTTITNIKASVMQCLFLMNGAGLATPRGFIYREVNML